MFKHILIPTDGSELSGKAIEKGVQFAKSIGARVSGLHVMPEYQVIAYDAMLPVDLISEEQFKQETEARAARFLGAVKKAAEAADVPCETASATSDHPWEEIIKTAQAKGCDLILMSSHGRRGLVGLILGSETTKVLTHTSIPVLVFR
ncbi:MAG: universal stress protein [Betaproteobacteria bacterium]|nr:universal stress protein [Betaproteobacteria bacterium]